MSTLNKAKHIEVVNLTFKGELWCYFLAELDHMMRELTDLQYCMLLYKKIFFF